MKKRWPEILPEIREDDEDADELALDDGETEIEGLFDLLDWLDEDRLLDIIHEEE